MGLFRGVLLLIVKASALSTNPCLHIPGLSPDIIMLNPDTQVAGTHTRRTHTNRTQFTHATGKAHFARRTRPPLP